MKKLYVIDKLNIGGASDYLFVLAKTSSDSRAFF